VPCAIAVKRVDGEAGRGLAIAPSRDLAARLALFRRFLACSNGNSAQFGQAGWSIGGRGSPFLSDFAPPLSLNVARFTEAQRAGEVPYNLIWLFYPHALIA
jgi:hypothetical protein